MVICNICGRSFEKTVSLSNHKRFHNLSENNNFKEKLIERMINNNPMRIKENRIKVSNSKKGIQRSDNTKQKIYFGELIRYPTLWI
jgi:hypothetical protein